MDDKEKRGLRDAAIMLLGANLPDEDVDPERILAEVRRRKKLLWIADCLRVIFIVIGLIAFVLLLVGLFHVAAKNGIDAVQLTKSFTESFIRGYLIGMLIR